jgi:hypothetical protein
MAVKHPRHGRLFFRDRNFALETHAAEIATAIRDFLARGFLNQLPALAGRLPPLRQ